MSGKKKSPKKMTQQEQAELVQLVREAAELISLGRNASDKAMDVWFAKADKILGKPE